MGTNKNQNRNQNRSNKNRKRRSTPSAAAPSLDLKLVRRAMRWDEDAFHEIYEATHDRMVHVAKKYMTKESVTEEDLARVIQEAHIRIWQELPKLDRPENYVPWASRIVAETAKLDGRQAVAQAGDGRQAMAQAGNEEQTGSLKGDGEQTETSEKTQTDSGKRTRSNAFSKLKTERGENAAKAEKPPKTETPEQIGSFLKTPGGKIAIGAAGLVIAASVLLGIYMLIHSLVSRPESVTSASTEVIASTEAPIYVTVSGNTEGTEAGASSEDTSEKTSTEADTTEAVTEPVTEKPTEKATEKTTEITDPHEPGWQEINGKRYYYDAKGKLKTGWLEEDGKWYFLNPTGEMCIGWRMIQGRKYYFDENGVMSVGKVNIDGQDYTFDERGAMVP